MQSRSLWIRVILVCVVIATQGRTETPEALTKGLFAGQSLTLTLGQEKLAPFLRAKGFASGDTIRLTHTGYDKIKIDRVDLGKPLSLVMAATDYLSPRQVSEMLTALGLQAEGPVTTLAKGDSITAIVTPEGSGPSDLLGRRGFETGDRVTVSNIGARFRIGRLAPSKPAAVIVPLGGFLYAEVIQEMATAFGLGNTTPVPSSDSTSVSVEVQVDEEVAQAQAEIEQMVLEANEGQVVTSVDFRQLKALLPESLPGLQRIDASAERMQTMGVDMAIAMGRYEKGGDEDTNIEIEIQDIGNLSGFMRQGMVSGFTQSFNNKTEHGYCKTTEYKGYKALEELDEADQTGMLHLYVAGRFLITIEGERVTMGAIHNAADQIDLKKLETLASAPGASTSLPSANDATTSPDADTSKLENMLEQLGQAGTGNLVDQDTLKSCLPATVAGFKRAEINSQQTAMSGVAMVMAEGRYEGSTPGKITITIMDTAEMGPEMRMGMAIWTIMDINRETDTGYQKTTTFGKYRAYELVDDAAQEATITIFPANRFYINVTGVNISMNKVRQVLGRVNLLKLEALAAR